MGTPYQDPDSGLNFYYYGDEGAPAPWPPGNNSHGKQIFPDIVNAARESGSKFEDPYFPASHHSLGDVDLKYSGGEDMDVQWKRPNEISADLFDGVDPVFKIGHYNQFGVKQGDVGDCWFLSTVADAAVEPEVIHTLIPKDNEEVGFDSGVFHFRFWCRGKWVDVPVDDRLPCVMSHKGKVDYTLMCKPTKEGGFWAPFLEKAYAKLYGKYKSISSGSPSCAMKDFTGGLAYYKSIDKFEGDKLKKCLAHVIKEKCLVAIGTTKIPENLKRRRNSQGEVLNHPEDVSTDGIVGDHAYSVLDIKDVNYNNGSGSVTLVECRNPWGSDTEWNGDFSDGDDQGWESVDQDLRTGSKTDGQFWIPIDNLRSYTDGLNVCHWSKDFRGDESGDTSFGETVATDGEFTELNSGHPGNSLNLLGKAGYYVNLKPKNPDSGEEKNGLRYNCILSISMLWKNYTISGTDSDIPKFGFIAIWNDGERVPDKKFFGELNNDVFYENYILSGDRSVEYYGKLPAGTVFIAPWINDYSDATSSYFLNITAEGKVHQLDPAATASQDSDGGGSDSE